MRLGVQKQRLFEAAAAVFSRMGYAEASAEAISREAGMSKATFYEHFANKEECMLALTESASRTMLEALVQGARSADQGFESRHRAGLRAVLATMEANPEMSQAVIVEMVGAGPRATERRDAALHSFAKVMYEETLHAAQRGGGPAFATRDDAFAIVGATFELASRQLRTGHPESMLDLQPLIERLILGLLSQPPG